MDETVLIGRGREVTRIPRGEWERGLSRNSHHAAALLHFMSKEHRLVRSFVVRELPTVGEPLSPEFIAQELNLPVAQVKTILDQLERHMVFLFRNEQGAVAWAYPVTVERTPHHVTFDTGEQVYAA
jgi:hypothetical protein